MTLPTEGARTMPIGTAAPVNHEPVHTSEGTITQHLEVEGQDCFHLTRQDKEDYGIKENESFAWIRNPDVWLKDEKSDRFREFRRHHPGARLPLNKEKEQCTLDDLVMVAYPKEQDERKEKLLREGMHEYQSTHGEDHDTTFQTDVSDNRSVQRLKEQRRREDKQFLSQSNTSGLSLEEAMARKSVEEMDADCMKALRGGRHQGMRQDEWSKLVNSDLYAEKESGKKTYAMPGVKIGPDTLEAVRRNKNAAKKDR